LSAWDVQGLEANFEGWRKERAPDMGADKAFELYAVEQVLRDADLTDEEIDAGLVGGSDDGGIDGIYFFVNRTLIQDETEVPDPALSADLVIIQAKNHNGFSEDVVEKIGTFTRDLFDYSKPADAFTYFSQSVRDAISNFREKYKSILGSQHSFSVRFYYVTKSDNDPHPKVTKRADGVKALVKDNFSAAHVEFNFWGCKRLLAEARTTPKKQFVLDVFKDFSTPDKSVVCLVKLTSYVQFLRDEHGSLRKSLLEPNVRDYQGKRNPVNTDIRTTLETASDKEFWWFNNGITILADDCSIAGDKLTITNPEVVNGLQSSQEIFSYFASKPDASDARHVLVRVIVLADEQTRNRVIKATNFQTTVDPLSLRSTEQVHFDIEERLKLYDLFYDRKKGKYRNLRKSISKIISIRSLAQSLIAIVLQRPNDARGGPQKLLNQDDQYKRVFSDTVDRDLYVVCALIDKQVEAFLETQTLSKEERRDSRYYVDMVVCCELLKNAKPLPKDIAGLLTVSVAGLNEADLNAATTSVLKRYKSLGSSDKTAKGPDLTKRLIEDLSDKYPSLSATAKGVKVAS
jgi:AIPR protein